MILSRIKRGAARAVVLARHKLDYTPWRTSSHLWRPVRNTILNILVLRIVLLPVPLFAPSTAVAANTSDSSDPSPIVRISDNATSALLFVQSGESTLVVEESALQGVVLGKSVATERAEQEAAAAQAAAEAAAAQKKARAAKTRILADYSAPTNIPGTEEVQAIIRQAAANYNVSANLLLRIAKCESGLNPLAKNRTSSASGLFQFMPGTYRNSPSGYAGLSIWDATANANAAAFKIANGAINAWSSSKSCWNK